LFYAALKFAFYKTINKKKFGIPNFDYDVWFKEYLVNFIKSNSFEFIKSENEDLLSEVRNINGFSEIDYIDIVKLVNIQLLSRI
jgi:hypothetical protein